MNLTTSFFSHRSRTFVRFSRVAVVLCAAILSILFLHGVILGVTLSLLLLLSGSLFFTATIIRLLPSSLHTFLVQVPSPPFSDQDEKTGPLPSPQQEPVETVLVEEATQPLEEEETVLTQRLKHIVRRLEVLFAIQQEAIAVEERNRLARDLHDCIKQEFYALGAQIQIANEVYHQPQRVQKHLHEATLLLQNIQEEIKNLIHNLRPAVLEEKGLVAALQSYVISWSRLCGIPSRFLCDPQSTEMALSLGQAHEEAIFRVAQETLSNVARHSGAWYVEVRFSCTKLETVLRVSDNGRGFDPEQTVQGIGILSMQERFRTLGGNVQIESIPEQGTTIVASFKHQEAAHEISSIHHILLQEFISPLHGFGPKGP